MLNEAEIRTFLDGVVNYFDVSARQPVAVGVPYLVTSGSPPVHDYTGVISVSGRRKGAVCFTAPRSMLMVLLMRMNETDTSEANMRDLVGEVANTISGNARLYFGPDFMISVPIVVQGSAQAIQVPRNVKAYVIPMRWHKLDAALVVSLQ